MMASGSNYGSTLVYPKHYTNDERVNQYVLQNTFELNHTMIINFQRNRKLKFVKTIYRTLSVQTIYQTLGVL